ncbi:hypothetical protein AAEP93_010537, partial [Penicillium crustosum]
QGPPWTGDGHLLGAHGRAMSQSNNRYYARMLTYGIPILSPPQYYDTTVKGVTKDLLKDA